MKYIKLILNGFVIGIANILPGVSGSALAMSMGIYEELVDSVGNFFKDIKKNLKFLIPIGVGAVLAILLFSKIINFFMGAYALPTICLFVGLMIGGIPSLFKEVKNEKKSFSNYAIFLVIFTGIVLLSLFKSGNFSVSFVNMGVIDYLLMFGVGVIAAATMVFPGISGTSVLMMIGYYKPILTIVDDLTNFATLNFNKLVNYGFTLAPFGLGIAVGGFLLSKLVAYLLKEHRVKTFYAILAFIFSSIVVIFIETKGFVFDFPNIILSVILIMAGGYIGYKMSE